MRRLILVSLALVFAACSHVAHNSCTPWWRYEPERQNEWPAACKVGPERSPVNITTRTDADYPQISIHYTPFVPRMYNNNRGAKFYADGNGGYVTVTYAGGRSEQFDLQELHLHRLGEHTFSGTPAPMELHFVNEDRDHNAKVVVTILFDVTSPTENPGLKEIIPIMPVVSCTYVQGVRINPMNLLPVGWESSPYYVYDGALTTPDCPGGLKFFILDRRAMTNSDQLARIDTVIGRNAKTVAVRELPGIPVVHPLK